MYYFAIGDQVGKLISIQVNKRTIARIIKNKKPALKLISTGFI